MINAMRVGVGLSLALVLCGSCSPEDSGSAAPEIKDGGPVDVRRGQAGAGSGEGWERMYEFVGKIAEAGLLSRYNRPYLRIDFDDRYVVVVSSLRVMSGTPPTTGPDTLALGVHSLVQLFDPMPSEGLVGRTYMFTVWRHRETGTLWLDAKHVIEPCGSAGGDPTVTE